MENLRHPPIGETVLRKETLRFVKGKGTYVDDISLPGTLHAAFVRSSYAHAGIERIDPGDALNMPGILGVFTGKEIVQNLRPMRVGGRAMRGVKLYPLAVEKVRYFGEPVAVVIGETRYLAEDAVEAVSVDYDPLPPVLDPEAAMQPDAPQVHNEIGSNIVFEWHFSTPNIDAVFQKADRVFSERIRSHRYTACPMEPRAYLAQYNPQDGQLSFWSATANPHSLRTRIAEIMDFPEGRIRVIAPDVGGSFGVKIQIYQEELILAHLSVKLQRPIKWCETRIDHLRNGRHGRDQTHYIQVAVKNDGTILAVKDRIIADMGSTYTVDNSIMASARTITSTTWSGWSAS